ncbi:hypothetical protein F3Y22_tig00110057pilonHSYRG00060 [Hibiscus syriacus]|uniref:DUF7890 domain-containing protein n=1 Tax=Hibiscus syriacus TaxID=106335 RepID=A0A6A3BM79_HIBSY|nr:hypothetical protein F3Y22_tig00110057pilonHSYRG00060 [Hibiscus syriacus]
MLTFIATIFCKLFSGEVIEFGASKSSSKSIYRDELSKKKPLITVKDDKKDRKMSRVRVKVKMTKEEAARLLSKCKDGGIIEFKDVACELVNLPMNRMTVVSTFPATTSLLHSIPEEC